MNPWKQIILLTKYDNLWEPIMLVNVKGETQRLFDYNSAIIKKILYTNDLIKYICSDKVFSIINDVNHILEMEDNKINNNQDVSAKVKYDLKKLNKMKLNELVNLSKELDITTDKKPTKAMLITLILEK